MGLVGLADRCDEGDGDGEEVGEEGEGDDAAAR